MKLKRTREKFLQEYPKYEHVLTQQDTYISTHPCYNNLAQTYAKICHLRYNEKRKLVEKQLTKELHQIAENQTFAFYGLQVYAHFTQSVLKIHCDRVPKLTEKEKRRLEQIIDGKINFTRCF